jgi:SagB-type dehydrogenase family enzyme
MADTKAPLFHNFVLNSTLSRPEMRDFAVALSEASPSPGDSPYFTYSGKQVKLTKHSDALQKVMDARASERHFDDKPLSLKELGSLCTPFSSTQSGGGRSWASAGGVHPVEVFVLPIRVKGLEPKVMYLDSATTSVIPVAPLPPWTELAELINPYPIEGIPAAIFLFVAMPSRTTRRYNERGGRFVLIEVGEALQNLALRAAADRLAGVCLGGVLDREMMSLLGLAGTDAIVCAAYACGHRATGSSTY